MDDDLLFVIQLSKAMEESKKIEDEYQYKNTTYPFIPKRFNIQKKLLDCNSRRDEIKIIDNILDLNLEFKLFLFHNINNSFVDFNNKCAYIFRTLKYLDEVSLYNQCNYILKNGEKSPRFLLFLGDYMKYKGKKLSTGLHVISNKLFYMSMKWIVIFSSKTLGMRHIWFLVTSFL